MKISLTEAAKKLDMHSFELVVALAPLVIDFSDIYPDVDEGLVQTVQQELLRQPQQPLERQAEGLHKARERPQLSDNEKSCLAKLARKKFWGHRTISENALRKSFLRESKAPDKSIEKLVRLGILIQHEKHKYSLNPRKKKIVLDLISG